MFYTQSLFLFNQTFNEASNEYKTLNRTYWNCINNENHFKKIKYNRNGIMAGLYQEIQELDGDHFCYKITTFGVDNTGCSADNYGGFLMAPTTDMITITL